MNSTHLSTGRPVSRLRALTLTGVLLRRGGLVRGVPLLAAACAPMSATAATPTSINVAIAFAPTSIASGATSQLTISFSIAGDNTDNQPAVLQAAFVNTLAPGLTVGAAVNSACAGASAATGATGIVFAAGGTIPAAGCSVTVPVTATTASGTAYFTDTIPAGAVQTTLGTNLAGATATLAAQAAVLVPNVATLTQSAAQAQLTAAGFLVVVVQQASTAVYQGGVIGTIPAAGATAARQSTIQLLVSSGPGGANAYATGPISNVPGLTAGQASVARALEKECAFLSGVQQTTPAVPLTAQQQDLLSKCSGIIANYAANGVTTQLQSTLNAVSGRQATAATRTPMQFAAGQVANLSSRLSTVRSGAGGGVSLGGLEMIDPQLAPLTALARSLFKDAFGGGAGDDDGGLLGDRLGIFLTGTLRRGSQSDTDAESGFRLSDAGATLGADYRFGSSTVLGVSAGYGRTTTGFDDNGGRMDAKHLSGQFYGSFFTEHFHLDWVAGYTHNKSDLLRQIIYQTDIPSIDCDGNYCYTTTQGTFTSRELTGSLGAGGDFHLGALSFGPTLETEYKQVHVNGFTETGSSGLDLYFGDLTTPSLVAKAGGYVSYAWKTRWMVILPQLRARYMHEFQNNARAQTVEFAADTFQDANTRSFQIFTDAADRSFYDWKASVLFQLPFGIAGFVDYGGIGGQQNIRMHEFNVGLRVEH